MAEVLPATGFDDAALCAAMNDAFSDYAMPMQLSEGAFSQMMRQRGLDRAASRVAVVEGQVVAIWLMSLRAGAGYLISSGTRPAFRSQGLSRRLGNACLAHMRAVGAATFQTEVMDGNDTAAGLYFSLGASVARRLDCYELPVAKRLAPEVIEADWRDITPHVAAVRLWEPTWQNSDASLSAIAEKTRTVAHFDDSGLAAYATLVPLHATVAQIAVRADRRRRGLGAQLLSSLQAIQSDRPLRVINADAGDEGFAAFMQALGARRTVGQRELFLRF